jgi:S-adenosylmethionine:tRNA ribosyltransferase-isomerase
VDVPEYRLPEGAIAQEPVEPRDAARLLVSLAEDRDPTHLTVADLPELLEPGDVLVLNTSRVLPARLRLSKSTGGAAEVMLVEPEGDSGSGSTIWRALVRPGRRLPPGTVLWAGERAAVEVGDRGRDGCRQVRLLVDDSSEATVAEFLSGLGTVPLPPYIHRELADPERYQTVYAADPGSVAAPTAGLHLSRAVLRRCRDRGVTIVEVDLAVGLGTFRPVRVSRAEDHAMHAEHYRVPSETLAACRRATRVVAVGTTTVRALETAAATGQLSGQTSLYIFGDFPFRVTDVLLTNFHQPRSSLLLLLDAFCGPRWRELYAVALDKGYRFLSFGDAMLVGRRKFPARP